MKKSNALLGAAIAGILGSTMATASFAKEAKEKAAAPKAEIEKCYGVNKCHGVGKCGGAGHACAGQNSCAGQGWLEVPKGLCEQLKDGSLTPKKAA